MHHVDCPSCGHGAKFREEHAGKTAKCHGRGTSFRLAVTAEGAKSEESPLPGADPKTVSVASSKPYAFFCPECDADLEMKRSAVGTKTTCPACAETIRVPRPGERSRPNRGGPESDPGGSKLTVGDWLVFIFLPSVGIIVGFVRLVMGKANGGAMLGYSVLSTVLRTSLKIALAALSSR